MDENLEKKLLASFLLGAGWVMLGHFIFLMESMIKYRTSISLMSAIVVFIGLGYVMFQCYIKIIQHIEKRKQILSIIERVY